MSAGGRASNDSSARAPVPATSTSYPRERRRGPTARWIGISAESGDNCVTIEVQDRGIGIPYDDLPLVQKKFVRGTLASPGGNGLGLALVSRIVKDHGGRFDIASTIGYGTTVRLQLPALEG